MHGGNFVLETTVQNQSLLSSNIDNFLLKKYSLRRCQVSDFFQIERNIIVVTVFLSIISLTDFYFHPNKNENFHYDHIHFNLNGIRKRFICLFTTAEESSPFISDKGHIDTQVTQYQRDTRHPTPQHYKEVASMEGNHQKEVVIMEGTKPHYRTITFLIDLFPGNRNLIIRRNTKERRNIVRCTHNLV